MEASDYLAMAIERARRGVARGQLPYGATIVRGDDVLACEHNVVRANNDPTAHAEVVAIRKACASLGATGLEGCSIYCTCEPCVMCFGACYFSGITSITFGASIADKAQLNLSDPGLRCQALAQQTGGVVRVETGLLHAESLSLFREFVEMQKATPFSG